jgi:hypothetical protein
MTTPEQKERDANIKTALAWYKTLSYNEQHALHEKYKKHDDSPDWPHEVDQNRAFDKLLYVYDMVHGKYILSFGHVNKVFEIQFSEVHHCFDDVQNLFETTYDDTLRNSKHYFHVYAVMFALQIQTLKSEEILELFDDGWDSKVSISSTSKKYSLSHEEQETFLETFDAHIGLKFAYLFEYN